MPKFLLISGSPRYGNTEFILKKIFQGLKTKSKRLILLRIQKITHCKGCLACDKSNQCALHDDMDTLYKLMTWADIYVIGTPNYFDNVPGLLKNFIDRTNPFYETDVLAGKRIFSIVVGGGKIKNSQRVAGEALQYFASAHKIKTEKAYYFQALKNNEVKNSAEANKKIGKIIQKLNGLN
ncbi:MAG: flavodoxin family protein [Patescibacteria group bacterium]|nr:flavodoxin family protein [Patescibacteria group bacterium]